MLALVRDGRNDPPVALEDLPEPVPGARWVGIPSAHDTEE
jgi:hypothetical protein